MLTQRWQVTPGFALCDAVHGAQQWSTTDQLMGEVLDALQTGNWQRGGGKGQRPKRFKRPWEEAQEKKFGSDPIPLSQFDNWWESAK